MLKPHQVLLLRLWCLWCLSYPNQNNKIIIEKKGEKKRRDVLERDTNPSFLNASSRKNPHEDVLALRDRKCFPTEKTFSWKALPVRMFYGLSDLLDRKPASITYADLRSISRSQAGGQRRQ